MEGQSHSENISTKTAGGRNQPANGNARIAYKSLAGVIVGWARVVKSKLPRNRRGTACCEMQSLLEG